MLPQQRKRGSYNTLDQKIWLIKHHDEHKKAKLAKMALDFSSQFNQPITKSAVSRILSNKAEIMAMSGADPEMNPKFAKKVVCEARSQFEAELEKILRKKYLKG